MTAIARLAGVSLDTTAVGLGAVRAAHQPAPTVFRVLLDPAGHPFCLTTMVPMD